MSLGAGNRTGASPRPGRRPPPGGPAEPPRSQIGVQTEIRRRVRRPRDYLRPALKVATLVALGLAFEIVYGQAPLYTGNQHTYVLHGLAQAGLGLLPYDWLANTTDPAPVTSALVALAAGLDAEWLLILFHALLLGAYGVALVGIGITLFRIGDLPRRIVFVALLLALHSWVASRIQAPLPDDLRSLVTKGVAGQYAPGLTFQPSLFGVLLIASLLAYARRRPLLAVGTASAAAIFHPTYLLSALILSGAYLADLYARTRAKRRVAQGAALATVLLAPMAVYALVAFAPTPGPAHEAAQSVLVDFRIPHHAKPSEWFAPDDAVRIALIVAGVLLAWRSVLFPVLALSVAASAMLTAIQLVTASKTLALLFPWRPSVWLVPVSTAIVLAALTNALSRVGSAAGRLLARLLGERRGVRAARAGRGFVLGLASLLIIVSLVAGLVRVERLSAEPRREPYASLVAGELRPGALFLVPPRVYEFRVNAEAPVYIDYKSNPYGDLEVLEWRRRLAGASAIYRRGRVDCRRLARLLRREPITGVVTDERTRRASCGFLAQVRSRGPYTLYRVEPGGGRRA